ncbi:VIT family protein [soil metagenome]
MPLLVQTWRMTSAPAPAAHPDEPHNAGIAGRLNWLRAGVLGANDGIVSVAAIVVGVAGATTQVAPILTAGVAGLVGGAISMALGEYVSVSSQRDTQRALIEKERRELAEMPEQELAELTEIYAQKGLSAETAHRVAVELTAHDALSAHLEAELHINETDVASPWQAAGASALAFFIGAILPMLAILLPPAGMRVQVTFAAVLVALALTGATSARIGGSHWLRPTLRVVIGGAIALAATFGIGTLLGTAGVV